jgi:hypothetical protein
MVAPPDGLLDDATAERTTELSNCLANSRSASLGLASPLAMKARKVATCCSVVGSTSPNPKARIVG